MEILIDGGKIPIKKIKIALCQHFLEPDAKEIKFLS
jgi:hypothetical protein